MRRQRKQYRINMQMLQVCIDNKINVGKWYEVLRQKIRLSLYSVVVDLIS